MKFCEDPERMQRLVNDYFRSCDKTETPYTVEGLALQLGFTETDSLLNYEKKEGYEKYFGIIKAAKLKIQKQRVEWGVSDKGNPNFIKFILINNSEYKSEKQVIENHNIDINSAVTDSELEKIICDGQ